jgi:hypothetical protein
MNALKRLFGPRTGFVGEERHKLQLVRTHRRRFLAQDFGVAGSFFPL